MPVWKFRSADEADRALLNEVRGTDPAARLRRLSALASHLSPRRFPTGVRRYRSLEEADRDRLRWLEEHIRSLQHRGR